MRQTIDSAGHFRGFMGVSERLDPGPSEQCGHTIRAAEGRRRSDLLVFRPLHVTDKAANDNPEEHYGTRTDNKQHDLVHGSTASFAG